MLASWSENGFDELPTTKLLLFLSSKLDPTIRQNTWSPPGSRRWTYLQIAHCIWSLLAAAVGGTLGRVLFAASERDHEQAIVDPDTGRQLPQKWRRGPVVIWLIGLALVASATLACSMSAPGLWAGVIVLLTCGMLGMATLGALVGQGSRRTMWLGAALFGSGYMCLTFGRSGDSAWPYLPTTHLLNAIRPGSLPSVSGFPDASSGSNLRTLPL